MTQAKRISRRQFNAAIAGLGAASALAPFGRGKFRWKPSDSDSR